MDAVGTQEIRNHVRIYITVFAALAILTIVTVSASYLDVPMYLAIGIALVIATIKGSLVACYFMHLISEKKTIITILAFSVIFLFAVLLLPIFTNIETVVSS